jgi:isochorismate hydrolase
VLIALEHSSKHSDDHTAQTERNVMLLWEKMNYFLRHTNHTKRLDWVIRTIRTHDFEDQIQVVKTLRVISLHTRKGG